jgi:hypothetical protein
MNSFLNKRRFATAFAILFLLSTGLHAQSSNHEMSTEALAFYSGPPPATGRLSLGEEGILRRRGTGLVTDARIALAKKYANFLGKMGGERIICQALRPLLSSTESPTRCTGIDPADRRLAGLKDEMKSIGLQVEARDPAGQVYEIELIGRSSKLALKNTYWVERHRIFVAFGFDAALEPQVTVFNFEPMLRTTGAIEPTLDNLFEYIGREHDSLLRAFQERIKTAISAATQDSYRKYVEGGN